MKMSVSRWLAPLFLVLSASACGIDVSPGPVVGEPEPLGSAEQPLGCTTQIVPFMTSSTAPQGTVFSSGNFSSDYPEWRAFDSSTSSMWISSLKTTPAILGYDAGAAWRVTRYAITYSNGSILTRAPKDWVFEGWNGSSWIGLDTRTGQTNWAGFQRREFAIATPGSYTKYRIRISDDNDTRSGVEVISMGNFELMGCDALGKPTWFRNIGSSGAWTQGYDMVGDPAARTYLVGATTGALDGQPRVGLMDGYLRATDWDGNLQFTHQFGVPNAVTLAYGIARNFSFEEFYVAGFTDGPLLGEPYVGKRSLFLTKTRYTGVRHWTRLLGSADGDTEGYGVAVDRNDNAFAVGSAKGNLDGNVRKSSIDAFITKFDPNGNKLWTRLLGTPSGRSWGRNAAADPTGNVYLIGSTEGSLPGNVNPGGEAGFLAKYDGAGNFVWAKHVMDQTCQVELRGVTVSYTNHLYVSGTSTCRGSFVAEYDANGAPVWQRIAGGWGSKVYTDAWGYMGDDNVYLGGSGKGDLENPSAPTSTMHGFIASFTPSGTKNSLRQLSAPIGGDLLVYGLTVDEHRRPYLGGSVKGTFEGTPTKGTDDAIVIKMP
jgi:hypothetical protein